MTKKKTPAKKVTAAKPGKIKGSNGAQKTDIRQAWERGQSVKTLPHVWEEKPPQDPPAEGTE